MEGRSARTTRLTYQRTMAMDHQSQHPMRWFNEYLSQLLRLENYIQCFRLACILLFHVAVHLASPSTLLLVVKVCGKGATRAIHARSFQLHSISSTTRCECRKEGTNKRMCEEKPAKREMERAKDSHRWRGIERRKPTDKEKDEFGREMHGQTRMRFGGSV